MHRKSFLGVDIGTSGIKVVQLERFQRQPKLVTYGYAESHFDVVRDQSEELQVHVAQTLSQVLAQSRVTSNMAVAALPTFAVFSSIITLPRMPKHDLATAIRWEAKKFIPLPIEEMSLDWKILDGGDNSLAERIFMMNLSSLIKKKEEQAAVKNAEDDLAKAQEEAKAEKQEKAKNVRVLLTAAPKTLVGRYVKIFSLAKVKLLSLETEAFALSRSLIGVEQNSVMIVDIGSSSTNICLIENGVPILNRGLDLGGYHISKSISNSLNVSFERAEQFKLDFGIRMQGAESGLPGAIKDSLQPIINEIQYVFELYQNQGSVQIDRVVLSGGSAFLPNFTSYLSQLLKTPVYIGNPWDRVRIPVDLKPVLDAIGPQMAVTIGLAMRNLG